MVSGPIFGIILVWQGAGAAGLVVLFTRIASTKTLPKCRPWNQPGTGGISNCRLSSGFDGAADGARTHIAVSLILQGYPRRGTAT